MRRLIRYRSLVIDHLRETMSSSDIPVLQIYFDHQNRFHRTPKELLGSLLRQLITPLPDIPSPLIEFHRHLEAQQRLPQAQDWFDWLLQLSRTFSKIFLVIDALDECESSHRKETLRFIDTIQQEANVSILVTSRPLEELKTAFRQTLSICIRATTEDLQRYIAHQIDKNDDEDLIDVEFKVELTKKISKSAQNM